MRGSYTQHLIRTSSRTPAVEKARDLHREECERRLAKIQNGADPEHKNGPWPGQKPGEVKE
jgi:hypothetical protein